MWILSFKLCIFGRKFLDNKKIFSAFSDSPKFKRAAPKFINCNYFQRDWN